MDGYVQAKIFTKQMGVQLPETQFSLPETSNYDELNALVNKLIEEKDENWSEKRFDFLINGSLLRVQLKDAIKDTGLSIEDVVSIECILKEEAPRPESSLPHDDWVGAVRVASDCIITGCYDSTLHVWSLKDKQHRLTIPGHSGAVKCLALIPNPANDSTTNQNSPLRFVSGSQDQSINVWSYDWSRNAIECVQTGRGHQRSVECVCSNGDGTRLATGSFDTFVKIWDTEESTENSNSSTFVVDSNTNETAKKKLKTGKPNDKTITKTPMVTLAGHTEAVTGVCWSATDPAEIFTCGFDRQLVPWDLELAGRKTQFHGPAAFTCISYSNFNGLILTGSVDPYVRLWDPRSKALASAKSVFSSHSGWLTSVQWSMTNENLFVSAAYDRYLKMWDVRSNKTPLFDLIGHEDRALCCDWSNPAYVASGGADNTVKLFSVPL